MTLGFSFALLLSVPTCRLGDWRPGGLAYWVDLETGVGDMEGWPIEPQPHRQCQSMSVIG